MTGCIKTELLKKDTWAAKCLVCRQEIFGWNALRPLPNKLWNALSRFCFWPQGTRSDKQSIDLSVLLFSMSFMPLHVSNLTKVDMVVLRLPPGLLVQVSSLLGKCLFTCKVFFYFFSLVFVSMHHFLYVDFIHVAFFFFPSLIALFTTRYNSVD